MIRFRLRKVPGERSMSCCQSRAVAVRSGWGAWGLRSKIGHDKRCGLAVRSWTTKACKSGGLMGALSAKANPRSAQQSAQRLKATQGDSGRESRIETMCHEAPERQKAGLVA